MLAMEAAATIKGKRTKRHRAYHPAAGSLSTLLPGSSSGETSSEEETDGATEEELEDMANCLILLARSGHEGGGGASRLLSRNTDNDGVALYECKTCNRVFPSFQALGGHRASHKKSKPNNNGLACREAAKPEKTTSFCFVDDTLSLRVSPSRGISGIPGINMISSSSSSSNKPVITKVHECSICGAEFTSGQALGGHMRRHRTTTSFTNQTTSSSSPDRSSSQDSKKPRNVLGLDLNLPAPEDRISARETTNFPFTAAAGKEQVIVFSASPLVDCHY